MKIAKNTVVTVDYSVADIEGNIVDEGAEPLVYLHGGYEFGLFPKIEEVLEGKTVGFSIDVELAPEDAFGEYDEELLVVEPRADFPSNIEVGMQFNRGDEDDESEEFVYTVTDIEDDKVVLDANHPLAGLALEFSCTVLAVREATAEELKNKQAM